MGSEALGTKSGRSLDEQKRKEHVREITRLLVEGGHHKDGERLSLGVQRELEQKDGYERIKELANFIEECRQGNAILDLAKAERAFALGMRNLSDLKLPTEELTNLIDESRQGNAILSPIQGQLALECGLKNLSDLKLHRFFAVDKDLTGFDFSNDEFSWSVFAGSKLDGTLFGRTELNDVSFHNSDLSKADLSSIKIDGKEEDLLSDQLQLKRDATWDARRLLEGGEGVGTCSDCEKWNERVLNETSWRGPLGTLFGLGDRYRRRGIVLFEEGKPLGYIKLKGAPSFLAMRTVKNEKGETLFWKGMVYSLSKDLTNWLDAQSELVRNVRKTWRRADMEKVQEHFRASDPGRTFARNNHRFIDSPEFYDKLSALTASIEKGEEPMIDILSDTKVESIG